MFHFIFSQINEKFSRSFDDSGLIKTIVLLNDPFQMDLRGNNSKKHNYTATLKSQQHKNSHVVRKWWMKERSYTLFSACVKKHTIIELAPPPFLLKILISGRFDN